MEYKCGSQSEIERRTKMKKRENNDEYEWKKSAAASSRASTQNIYRSFTKIDNFSGALRCIQTHTIHCMRRAPIQKHVYTRVSHRNQAIGPGV